MTAEPPPVPPAHPAEPGLADSFLRRQLVLAVVAGGVVLVAVAAVALAVPDGGGTSHAALRVGADGRVTPVSPLGESSRAALWAAGLALLAVAVVLTLALDHMWRVARLAVLGRGGGPARPPCARTGADQEIPEPWQ